MSARLTHCSPDRCRCITTNQGDVGIENHADVVFVERFDEATLSELFNRWTDVLNDPAMHPDNGSTIGRPAR